MRTNKQQTYLTGERHLQPRGGLRGYDTVAMLHAVGIEHLVGVLLRLFLHWTRSEFTLTGQEVLEIVPREVDWASALSCTCGPCAFRAAAAAAAAAVAAWEFLPRAVSLVLPTRNNPETCLGLLLVAAPRAGTRLRRGGGLVVKRCSSIPGTTFVVADLRKLLARLLKRLWDIRAVRLGLHEQSGLRRKQPPQQNKGQKMIE